MYEDLNCTEYFSGYESQYASLQNKDLTKFLNDVVMPRIAKENADRDIDKKRALACSNLQKKEQMLRGSIK